MGQLITEDRFCSGCEKPMIAERQWRKGNRPKGHVEHHAKGMCRPCYRSVAPLPKEIQGVKLDRVLEAWTEFALYESTQQIADRLGMTRSAFDMALSRARKKGDPRAKTRIEIRDEMVLEDWAFIRDDYPFIRLHNGKLDQVIVESAARRLNTTADRLENILARARERGDDRGRIIYDLRRSA
jgi:hypothetical protein